MTVDSTFRISDIPIAAFGSRAHLEEKALATVQYCDCPCCFICIFLFLCFSFTFHCLVEILHLISEEVVPQFFDEGFPSCCYLDCWSWNSWYTGKFLLRICFFLCGVTILWSNNVASLSNMDFLMHQCGFKMFTRAAARKLFTNIRLKRWLWSFLPSLHWNFNTCTWK